MSSFDTEQAFKDLGNAIIRGDAPTVDSTVRVALDEGVEASSIINDGMIPGMDVVGELFRTNQYYVPEVLISARAMKAGMAILRPILAESGIEPVGEVVIGTVRGDLHDIGKNLVAMMLEGAGFGVHDTGIDTHPDEYIQNAVEHNAN
ncbi:MAG: B12-binding domain-containing protein, partial [Chloroflexota bacterium]|nr:B12-binding domain-containing protein [Chloroflexota bacterium]